MSDARKLTTILAADVADYSRLAATDEERVVASADAGQTFFFLSYFVF
jgi:hypothetical protein